MDSTAVVRQFSSNNAPVSSQQMNGPTCLFGSETYMGIASPARSDYSGVFSSTPANVPVPTAASLVARNPLEGTHELRQACQACFIKKGEELGGGLWGNLGSDVGGKAAPHILAFQPFLRRAVILSAPLPFLL